MRLCRGQLARQQLLRGRRHEELRELLPPGRGAVRLLQPGDLQEVQPVLRLRDGQPPQPVPLRRRPTPGTVPGGQRPDLAWNCGDHTSPSGGSDFDRTRDRDDRRYDAGGDRRYGGSGSDRYSSDRERDYNGRGGSGYNSRDRDGGRNRVQRQGQL
ncbi:hypothetical protein CEXT_803701 [Caerostris extrusa]|uniref:Uncharacterized protein n=1 Tax=Caerostris extrusa TaxID=172846 RepID=A0AAV4YDF3_CAEEX|nr:hypothetical protein CEXT_803701 [Caerostris extrusa]